MDKIKRNSGPKNRNSSAFFKAVIFTVIAISLVVIGFVAAGFFFGMLR